MTKIKIPLIFSVIALVLSFLIGLISGVAFLSILIRSVILSLITGIFVFGARELLERFVPELFNPMEEDVLDQENSETKTGQNLNISINEPIDLEAGNQDKAKIFNNDAVSENANEEKQNLDNEIEELEELNSEVEKDISTSTASTNEDNDIQNQSNKEAEVEELNELPDLQEFIPAESTFSDTTKEDFTQTGTGKFDVSADLNNTEIDTNVMAQAVQTVLRRDS